MAKNRYDINEEWNDCNKKTAKNFEKPLKGIT